MGEAVGGGGGGLNQFYLRETSLLSHDVASNSTTIQTKVKKYSEGNNRAKYSYGCLWKIN